MRWKIMEVIMKKNWDKMEKRWEKNQRRKMEEENK